MRDVFVVQMVGKRLGCLYEVVEIAGNNRAGEYDIFPGRQYKFSCIYVVLVFVFEVFTTEVVVVCICTIFKEDVSTTVTCRGNGLFFFDVMNSCAGDDRVTRPAIQDVITL